MSSPSSSSSSCQTAPPQTSTIVLRPSFHHRHLYPLLSPSLLLSLLLHPPHLVHLPDSLTLTFLLQPLSLQILHLHPAPSVPSPTTQLHLLPPHPSPSPSPDSLSLAPFLPPSLPLLLLSPSADVTPAPTVVLSPSLLLSSPSLASYLRRLILSSAALPTPPIILLTDAHLVFPPNDPLPSHALLAALTPPLPPLLFILVSQLPLHPSLLARVDHSFAPPATPPRHIPVISANSSPLQTLNTRWEALHDIIIGMPKAKRILKRLLVYPRTRVKEMHNLGVLGPKGALLYGSPGTGKTALVRSAAMIAGYDVVKLDAVLVASGVVGEAESNVETAFRVAQVRERVIIFVDEIDAMFHAGDNGRVARVLGRCMEECGENVVIIAATNRLDRVEKGLLREGRFEYVVEVEKPNKDERMRIGKVYGNVLGGKGPEWVMNAVSQMEGLTGADIRGGCRRAAGEAFSRGEQINEDDVWRAFKDVQRSRRGR